MIKSLYLIGSLKNDSVPYLANKIRSLGIDCFEDWHRAGKDADDFWKAGEEIKGSNYKQALKGWAAQHVYKFDKTHLDRCDGALLVLPAGKSGHLEAGYMKGSGKWLGIYFPDGEPENTRWDIMYNFADEIVYGEKELIEVLSKKEPKAGTITFVTKEDLMDMRLSREYFGMVDANRP